MSESALPVAGRADGRPDLRAARDDGRLDPAIRAPVAIEGSNVASTSTTEPTGGWKPSLTTTCTAPPTPGRHRRRVIAGDEVPRPDDVVAQERTATIRPTARRGIVERIGRHGRGRSPDDAEVGRHRRRAEREVAGGEHDGDVGAEVVRTPVQRTEIAGDDAHRGQHDDERGGPREQHTR